MNRIRNAVCTALLAAFTIGLNTTPVRAETASLKKGNVVAKETQEEVDQEFENYCNNALASMNLNGKSWKEKADAITDYTSWNFRYDYQYSSAYSMFKYGGGDCWASSDMICALGSRAGFAATPRNMNIAGGVGHRDALLQDPDGNVYSCEAGWVRDVNTTHSSAVQIGSATQLAYDPQPYQIYQFTDATQSEVTHVGPFFDNHIIGVIYNFHNTVIQLPTDGSIHTLGYDTERVVNDNNNDPAKTTKIEKDYNGNWMVDATIGDPGWFQHQFYYDPFMLCDQLQTVKVGSNITKISDTALKGTYLTDKRSFKFEVDPANPVYANTADGGLMLKVDNDQGKAGDVIYTPTTGSTEDNNTSYAGTDQSSAQTEGNVTMYRAYNPNSGEHFYTSNTKEFNYIVSLGWRNEGTGWIAPQSSGTPVYRLYNSNGGEHHYTMSEKEKNYLVAQGWKDEGIGWYSDDQQRVPLYRQYNPNAFANNHNYTTADKEKNYLLSIGWRDEGIGWYGVSEK